MSKIREKNKAQIVKELKPLTHLLKSWYLNIGYDFIQSRKFTQPEEDIIAEMSDYYLDRIKDLAQQ